MSRRLIVVEPTTLSPSTMFDRVELRSGQPHSLTLRPNTITSLQLPFDVKEALTGPVRGFQFQITDLLGEKGVILVGAYPQDSMGTVKALVFASGPEVTIWPQDVVLIGTAYETIAMRQSKPVTEPLKEAPPKAAEVKKPAAKPRKKTTKP